MTTVGDIAAGRAGDKGSTLDVSIVAADRAAYEALQRALDADTVAARLAAPSAVRYELPQLLALKYVLEGALDAGPWASRRAGVHWQKAAVSALLSMPLSSPPYVPDAGVDGSASEPRLPGA